MEGKGGRTMREVEVKRGEVEGEEDLKEEEEAEPGRGEGEEDVE